MLGLSEVTKFGTMCCLGFIVYLDLCMKHGQFQHTVNEIGTPQLNWKHVAPTSPLKTPTCPHGCSFRSKSWIDLSQMLSIIYLNVKLVMLAFATTLTKDIVIMKSRRENFVWSPFIYWEIPTNYAKFIGDRETCLVFFLLVEKTWHI